jgi:UDP-glucose 4-epimerase
MSVLSKVVVTGGAGYIGSTVCSALSDAGHVPIIWDSLVTGQPLFARNHAFYQGDIASAEVLDAILRDHPEANTVIHCAARIIVPESMSNPHLYYLENVTKSLALFENLRLRGKDRIVFSSSASVYAQKENFAVSEDDRRDPKSPYARTKAMMEDILFDYFHAYGTKSIILRYFNPIGADPEMRSGPFVPNPSHLLGRLVQTASGKLPVFGITGCDWPTRDGSGIRDYIHVWDLAQAHVRAVERFDSVTARVPAACPVINLGTGSGVTVKEFVNAFERVLGRAVNKQEDAARPGDNAGCYTVTTRARDLLGWSVQKGIEQGIADALKWDAQFAKRLAQNAE